MSPRAQVTIAWFFTALCASSAFGCKDRNAATNGTANAAPDAAPQAAEAARDAEPRSTSHESLMAKGSGRKKSGGRSLLSWTDAKVAVSSTVDNPRDFPEHLIDGRLDTAWNGKTGDLEHGYILFRVPREAHVQKIRLTSGYVAKSKDGRDLFTSNYRISGARVTRDGAPFRDIVLDIENRGVQSFDIDAPGGDFKIEVLEVHGGSVKSWRELVVSEFDVIGDPGTAKLSAPHTPRVRVGSLDADTIDAGKQGGSAILPQTSIAAYCKAFVRKHEASVVAEFSSENFPCREPTAHAECTAGSDTPIDGLDPFVALRSIDYAGTDSMGADTVVTTKSGAFDFIGGEAHGRCELGDPGSQTFTVVSQENAHDASGAPMFLVVTDSMSISPMFGNPETDNPATWLSVSAKRELVVCVMKSDRPNCDKRIALGSFNGRGDASGSPPSFEEWDDAKKYVVKSDGTIVTSPISDAGSP